MSPLEVGLLAAMVLMTGAWIAALAALRIARREIRDLQALLETRPIVDVAPIDVIRLRNAADDLLGHAHPFDSTWLPCADERDGGLPAEQAFEREVRALQDAIRTVTKGTR